MDNYYKYLKYKQKYKLLNQSGGTIKDILCICTMETHENNKDIEYLFGKYETVVTFNIHFISFNNINSINKDKKFSYIFFISCDHIDTSTIFSNIIKLKENLESNGIIYIKSTNHSLIQHIRKEMINYGFEIIELPSTTSYISLSSTSSPYISLSSTPKIEDLEPKLTNCYYSGI